MRYFTPTRLFTGFTACLLTCHLLAAPTFAAMPADAYADAVDSSTNGAILNASAALGAPDNQYATVVSGLNQDLVLDMGVAEEGTGNLSVTYNVLSLGIATQVDFLRADKSVIASGTLNLATLGLGKHTTTVTYSAAPTPYRYVRFKSVGLQLYLIDAVQAASYSTDTDGDGLPNEWEVGFNLDWQSALGNNGATGDPDSDGLSNIAEYAHGTNPLQADTDGDGLTDGWEVQFGLNAKIATGINGASGDPDSDSLINSQEASLGTNPFSNDSDGDTLLDGWEAQYGLHANSAIGIHGAAGDPDSDGLTNVEEYAHGTNPMLADTDGDGLNDGWEVQFGLDPRSAVGINGANGDPDSDGQTNLQEYIAGTNPTGADSDGDGMPDSWEMANGLNPNNAAGNNGAAGDPDNDGLTNAQEYARGTNPANADTDGDTLPDGWEVKHGLDPKSATGNNGAAGDPDGDKLANSVEFSINTSPTNADTDGDTLNDGWEKQYNLDPNSAIGVNGAAGDPDNDKLVNADEDAHGTDPKNPDSDQDNLPDGWEVQYNLDPLNSTGDDGAAGDPDKDGRTNMQEWFAGSNPRVADAGDTSAKQFSQFVPMAVR